MFEFLYFPEDKTEYIPGLILMLLFTIGSIFAMYYMIKISKRQAKQADEKYQHLNKNIPSDETEKNN